MTKPFDPTKPVRLRDGTPARVICTDRKGECPIVILIDRGASEESTGVRFADGRIYEGRDRTVDVVNVPEKHSGWINLYLDDDRPPFASRLHKTEEQARASRFHRCVATIQVEWEEEL